MFFIEQFVFLLVHLLMLIVLTTVYSLKEIDVGVCDKILRNGTKLLYCCQGYIENHKEDACTKCPLGTIGTNCEYQCKEGYYGVGCSSCNCSFKICHSSYGCDVKTTESLQKTQSVITEGPFVDSEDSVVTLRQIITTAAVSSAITVAFLIAVIIGVLIAKRVICKNQQDDRVMNSVEVISANAEIVSQLSSPQEPSSFIQRNAISDSQYETIDELNMVENSTIEMNGNESVFRKTNISSSSNDSNTSIASGVASEDTEGYLHPYNTLLKNWQN